MPPCTVLPTATRARCLPDLIIQRVALARVQHAQHVHTFADVADDLEQVGARLLRPMDRQRQRRRADCLCSAAWMMASVSATTSSCGTEGRVSAMLFSTRLRNQASCAWASCWVPNSDSIGASTVFMEASVIQSCLRSHLPAERRALTTTPNSRPSWSRIREHAFRVWDVHQRHHCARSAEATTLRHGVRINATPPACMLRSHGFAFQSESTPNCE